MLFDRWLRTQLNICDLNESLGGLRLFAGGIFDGITLRGETLIDGFAAIGGSAVPSDFYASGSIDGFGTGHDFGNATLLPISLNSEFGSAAPRHIDAPRNDRGNAFGRLMNETYAEPVRMKIWTQDIFDKGMNLLHALLTTLNIRQRQSHVRRLCGTTP